MSLFKCKMCGGDLEIAEGVTVAECEYCGTKQAVPKAMDENLQNLFNRANTLRMKGEFDKAEKLYEKIIQVDSTQSEAYWGLILCKFGIEYVDDPTTFKKVPTCHRTSYDSIVADDDYKAAIEKADVSQRALYEEQAREIDRIQKEILALAQNEETYDVFICYKETDSNGKRTLDSVIANDIYYQLTQEGYKVFYAAITLEGKLGSAYEPVIFAALNSAKVMLVIGTKPEYFNAVWVKNEWSRYLNIIKQDRSKMLVPCYRDMDAYELPDEFAHLQAQDMAKIGFINDIVRGIKKVIKNDEPHREPTVNTANSNIAPLLERAFMFLEDGEWDSANEYCEKVLDLDPKNAAAYLGKLMAELHVKKQVNLKDCEEPFDNNSNYQKAIRFATSAFAEDLKGYVEAIRERNERTAEEIKAKKEAERLEKERKAEIERKEAERIAKRNKKIAIITTPIVCVIIAFIIVLNTVIIPNGKYNDAITLMDAGNIVEAYEALVALEGYKDSTDKANSIYDKYKVEKLKVAKVGDYVFFGAYEQDNNTSNGKEVVEWLVLEVKDGKTLVISKYALDCKQYNTSDTDVTWETCTLRKWLNNDFLGAAFSADEKAMIPTVTVSADKNPVFSTNPGNTTQDQVFLLSMTEANKYFSSDSAKLCKPTDYAVANGAWENDSDNCWWWLRSPGHLQNLAAFVFSGGSVGESGSNVDRDDCAVRPVMWIDLSVD